MGRPRGSKNREEGNGEEIPMRRNTVDPNELRAYIGRIENINQEQKALSVDRSQVYKELREAGYNRKAVQEIIQRRKLTEEQRQEAAATLDMYLSALGDFADMPLGQAAAARMREAAGLE